MFANEEHTQAGNTLHVTQSLLTVLSATNISYFKQGTCLNKNVISASLMTSGSKLVIHIIV